MLPVLLLVGFSFVFVYLLLPTNGKPHNILKTLNITIFLVTLGNTMFLFPLFDAKRTGYSNNLPPTIHQHYIIFSKHRARTFSIMLLLQIGNTSLNINVLLHAYLQISWAQLIYHTNNATLSLIIWNMERRLT